MTIWIMPEIDREGWAACMFWLQGGNNNEALTYKKSRLLEPPSDPPFGPPLF